MEIYLKFVQELGSSTDQGFTKYIWTLRQIFDFEDRGQIRLTSRYEVQAVEKSLLPSFILYRYI